MWRTVAPNDGLNFATLPLAFQPDKLQCRHRGASSGAAMLVSDRRRIKPSRSDASVPTKGVCHASSQADDAPPNRRDALEAGLWRGPVGSCTAARRRHGGGSGGDCAVSCRGSAGGNIAASVSNNDGDAADPQRGTGPASASGDATAEQFVQSSWAQMLLSMPLELAAASARTNQHWLQKRKRKHWWSREHFPRVPMDTLSDVHQSLSQADPPVKLWQKLLPLALIFFCASFNLTILANLKDAIVVTSAGAEALPFLASFCVLPASLASFFLYGKLVSHLPPRMVFYASVVPLVAFYAFFAGALYPASAYLHPHGFYERMAPLLPIGLHGLLKVIEHWTFSLFFCIAELWGAVVISVLFWTLANDVCTVADAKIIYPSLGIAANIALVVAGNYMKWVNAALTSGSLLLSLRYLVATVLVLSGVMMGAKLYIDGNIKSIDVPDKAPKKKAKKKGTIADSLAVLRSSPKTMNLALLVMSYGVSHRLFEFAWKGQLRALYPSAQAYQGMLADVSIATGWMTIALMLTGRFVFQYLGWGVAATATPLVMLLAGGTFFWTSMLARVGGAAANLAAAGATAGAVTQVFARSSKFSLFDPAKEMVFIEMSKEEKSKGKAAVDLVGSQIGKSGASWITQALLLATGSIQAALPVIAAIFTGVIACWIRAVSILHNTIKREEAEAAAKQAAEKAAGDVSDDEGTTTIKAGPAGPAHATQSPEVLADAIATQHASAAQVGGQHASRWQGSTAAAVGRLGHAADGQQHQQHSNGSGAPLPEKEHTS